MISSRKYEELFGVLSNEEPSGMTKLTGCKKPCHYLKFSFVGVSQSTSFKSDLFVMSFWAAFNFTMVEKETLIYPFPSLIAELGGTLGLFLGFSFLAIWDSFERIGPLFF